MALLDPRDVEGKRYDVVVIGSGMGGAAAALRAAQLGLKAVIVEKGLLGGTCVNVGCVPTKYLLNVSEKINDIRLMAGSGLVDTPVKPVIRNIMRRKKELIDQVISWYLDFVFPSYGVDVVKGFARLKSHHEVVVDGATIEAKNIVIATGSTPAIPPINGLREALEKGFAITSNEALSLEEVPEKLVVIGGGPVGVELATVWHGFGSRVTIVEMMDRLLPAMDPDVGRTLKDIMVSRGISVLTGVKAVKIDAERKRVVLDNGHVLEADKVLIATGRKPYVEGLGLENVGVKIGGRGEILVDRHARTSVPNIYAVGDVTGEPYVASIAKVQGIVAAENIAGNNIAYDDSLVPIAVYSDPEAAGVGVSASKGDPRFIVKRFPVVVNYKAIASERPYGVAKIVADKATGRLVGFHMVGVNASEVVNVAVMAIRKGFRLDEALEVIFSHPVMSETLIDAMHLVKGITVYLPKR